MSAVEHSLSNRAGAPVFKRGDRVRLLEFDQWTDRAGLVTGAVYTVESFLAVPQPVVKLVAVEGKWWRTNRFELVKRSDEPGWSPGEGWREVDDIGGRWPYLVKSDSPGMLRYWVQEAAVPPLPTEPYTVIRVQWRIPKTIEGAAETLLLARDGMWQVEDERWDACVLRADINGFEVLSEPRAATASAVLDQVEARAVSGTWHVTLIDVVREFGGAS